MRAALVVAIALALATVAGCSSGPAPPPSSCPNDLPAACPSPQPHFAADVQPIFQSSCLACHTADGAAAIRPFGSYDEIRAQLTTIIMQIRQCKMPPAYAPPLTEEQRLALLGWVVCGALND